MAGLPSLEEHEGFVPTPRDDGRGNPTIGFGTNLKEGITEEQARALMALDVDATIDQLSSNLPWFKDLSPTRQAVLVNMGYNLGVEKLMGFEDTLASIEAGDFEAASKHMLDSKWEGQVGDRADELAEAMRTGQYDKAAKLQEHIQTKLNDKSENIYIPTVGDKFFEEPIVKDWPFRYDEQYVNTSLEATKQDLARELLSSPKTPISFFDKVQRKAFAKLTEQGYDPFDALNKLVNVVAPATPEYDPEEQFKVIMESSPSMKASGSKRLESLTNAFGQLWGNRQFQKQYGDTAHEVVEMGATNRALFEVHDFFDRAWRDVKSLSDNAAIYKEVFFGDKAIAEEATKAALWRQQMELPNTGELKHIAASITGSALGFMLMGLSAQGATTAVFNSVRMITAARLARQLHSSGRAASAALRGAAWATGLSSTIPGMTYRSVSLMLSKEASKGIYGSMVIIPRHQVWKHMTQAYLMTGMTSKAAKRWGWASSALAFGSAGVGFAEVRRAFQEATRPVEYSELEILAHRVGGFFAGVTEMLPVQRVLRYIPHERATDILRSGRISEILARAEEKARVKSMLEHGKGFSGDVGAETLQESVQGLVEDFVDNLTIDPSITWQDSLAGIPADAAGGAYGGAIMSLAARVIGGRGRPGVKLSEEERVEMQKRISELLDAEQKAGRRAPPPEPPELDNKEPPADPPSGGAATTEGGAPKFPDENDFDRDIEDVVKKVKDKPKKGEKPKAKKEPKFKPVPVEDQTVTYKSKKNGDVLLSFQTPIDEALYMIGMKDVTEENGKRLINVLQTALGKSEEEIRAISQAYRKSVNPQLGRFLNTQDIGGQAVSVPRPKIAHEPSSAEFGITDRSDEIRALIDEVRARSLATEELLPEELDLDTPLWQLPAEERGDAAKMQEYAYQALTELLAETKASQADPKEVEAASDKLPEVEAKVEGAGDTGIQNTRPKEKDRRKISGKKEQPRDRSSTASIIQMQKIANNPKFSMVAASSYITEGAPVVEFSLEEDIIKGKEVTMFAQDQEMKVLYAIIEAANVEASHNADGEANPAYFAEERDKRRAVNNGRIAGLQRAYMQNTASEYRSDLLEALDEFGISSEEFGDQVEVMNAPILVRVLPIGADFPDISSRSNRANTAAMSSREQAKDDARRLQEAGIPEGLANQNLNYPQSMPFVRKIIEIIRPDDPHLWGDGREPPTEEAYGLVRRALLVMAWRNDSLLEWAVANPEDHRNLLNILTQQAANIGSIKEEHGHLDTAETIMNAILAVRSGASFESRSMFENHEGSLTELEILVAAFIRDFATGANTGIGIARAFFKEIGEKTRLAGNSQHTGILGDEHAVTVSADDIIIGALKAVLPQAMAQKFTDKKGNPAQSPFQKYVNGVLGRSVLKLDESEQNVEKPPEQVQGGFLGGNGNIKMPKVEIPEPDPQPEPSDTMLEVFERLRKFRKNLATLPIGEISTNDEGEVIVKIGLDGKQLDLFITESTARLESEGAVLPLELNAKSHKELYNNLSSIENKPAPVDPESLEPEVIEGPEPQNEAEDWIAQWKVLNDAEEEATAAKMKWLEANPEPEKPYKGRGKKEQVAAFKAEHKKWKDAWDKLRALEDSAQDEIQAFFDEATQQSVEPNGGDGFADLRIEFEDGSAIHWDTALDHPQRGIDKADVRDNAFLPHDIMSLAGTYDRAGVEAKKANQEQLLKEFKTREAYEESLTSQGQEVNKPKKTKPKKLKKVKPQTVETTDDIENALDELSPEDLLALHQQMKEQDC